MNFRFWHITVSEFWTAHRHFVWILLLQSIWRFTNWCVWRTTAEDAFPPCFSILYSYHFSHLSVLQPLNCRKRGKHSSPSHHNLIHFDSSVLRYSVLRFYISLLLTRTNSFSFLHFIMMLLQKEQGCQFSGLNWCIYSNAIKKFYLSRCYSCSCVFVFISFCTADARSLVNFAT